MDMTTAVNTMKFAVLALAVTTFALMASTIALAVQNSDNVSSTTVVTSPAASAMEPAVSAPTSTPEPVVVTETETVTETVVEEVAVFASTKGALPGDNFCNGNQIDLPNVECIAQAVEEPGHGPQAGANVTKGYNGDFNTSSVPITIPYYQAGLCPVNVHWHLGAEHYSLGEYDENGKLHGIMY